MRGSMLRAFWAAPLCAALLATPVAAAQVVSLTFTDPDQDGFFSASGAFDWPIEGTKALAKLTFSGAQLLDGYLTGYVEGQATWWDTFAEEVTGNEYLLAFDCDTANGCLQTADTGLAYGWQSTPRGFDKPCGPATLGDCSFHYDPQSGNFDGYFRTMGSAPYSVTLTIGEFAAVPEPATWALMIVGFGLAGGTLRKRRALAHAA